MTNCKKDDWLIKINLILQKGLTMQIILCNQTYRRKTGLINNYFPHLFSILRIKVRNQQSDFILL